MKYDRYVTAAIAAALAFLTALGTVGCVVTAFELPVNDLALTALGCALPALLGAAAFSRKGGALVAVLLCAAAGIWLWRQGDLGSHWLALISRLSAVYDRAYGWGVIPFNGEAVESFHLPLGMVGALTALAVSWTVCRGVSAVAAMLPALTPLAACLVVTDTVPQPRFLWCLFFGLLMLLLTGHTRRSSPYQGNRLTCLAALPVALALGALMLAIPQEGYVNYAEPVRQRMIHWLEEAAWEETQGGDVSIRFVPQEPERLELLELGSRTPSNAPVMWVSADTGGVVYLRGQDYDRYDGASWGISPHRVEPFSCSGPSLGLVTVQTGTALERMYLPYYPDGELRLVEGRLENSRLSGAYAFTRLGLPGDWRDIALAHSGEVSGMESYQELPEQTRAQAQTLLEELSAGPSVTERAEAIARLVRETARYDLNAPSVPQQTGDFALWFLEEAEAGYCVHFATASVVLLRAAGIPARYVSGYLVTLRAGQTAAVTGEQAHAWAEYYEPALETWLVLESTPGAADAPVYTVPAETEQPVQTTQPETTAEAPTQPDQTDPKSQATAPAASDPPEDRQGVSWAAVGAILILPLLAAVLELQSRLRRRLRRGGLRRGGNNAQALARWQEAVLLARLAGQTPPGELEQLALKAKFSSHTLTREELNRFDRYIRGQTEALSRQPWHRRLLYRYWYAIY